ncbi:hypothetical protein AVEN_14546-1 [Araneus ventricosus]|uniref:Uncharacterized protein n=1 Tax=Araneus ventricosus TaxID=182803 RepID=A0A4Y2CGF5_ARAVE|nr:hypothetical protein AVEN_14546-1 [Araneus ventricosus]
MVELQQASQIPEEATIKPIQAHTIPSHQRLGQGQPASNFNIQNFKKVQIKGLVVVCDKEEDISKLVNFITDKEDLGAKIETKAPGKRHRASWSTTSPIQQQKRSYSMLF